MDRFEHPLKKPCQIKNGEGEVIETIEKLSLRELLGGDAKRITASAPVQILIQMVGAASDLPPSTVDKLPLFELLAAGEAAAAAGFFGDIPATLGR